MSKLKRNLGLQTIYQILATAIPLITSPYLSRKLGATGLGIYSYTYSIVNYFMLFAMLGLTNYGTRSIAMAKDKEEENRLFSEIYSLQLLTTSIAMIAYFLLLVCAIQDNRVISLIQTFWLASCFLDVSWYFFGKEEFKVTVTRNIIIKLMTVAAIFVFVKTESDIWKYAFIMAFGTFVSQFALSVVLRKYVRYQRPQIADVLKHVKPNVILFVPIMAMTVYHLMDKTMLGALSEYSQSGYYYNADKVINIPLGIITGVGTVMLSKVSTMRSEGKDRETRALLGQSVEIFTCLSVAMAFGVAAIANEFVPLFFGNGYDECVNLIYILSMVMIFKTLSNTIRTQYLIPYNKEKQYIIGVTIGAIINFIINYTLIGVMDMGATGACIGTIVAEALVCVLQYALVEKELHLRGNFLRSLPYVIFGLLMFIVVRTVANISASDFVKIIVEIASGAVLYVGMCLLYWVVSKNPLLKQIVKIRR